VTALWPDRAGGRVPVEGTMFDHLNEEKLDAEQCNNAQNKNKTK
jgi:hypothetical protein